MGLDEEKRIVVSGLVNGSTDLEEWLHRFEGQPPRTPRTLEQVPLEEYVRWHVQEVFKGREVAA